MQTKFVGLRQIHKTDRVWMEQRDRGVERRDSEAEEEKEIVKLKQGKNKISFLL